MTNRLIARAAQILALALALAAVLLVPRAARAATTIPGGNIINQTWTPAGSPYIVQGDVTVPAGAFLNIQAGTVVQFPSGDVQAAGLVPVVLGTPSQGRVFFRTVPRGR